MKYMVIVTEKLSKNVFVEAKSDEEAKAKAEAMWVAGEVEIDYGNFSDVTYEAVGVNEYGV